MNWTGGRLNRHARTNQISSLRAQKQRFAKASFADQAHNRDKYSGTPNRLQSEEAQQHDSTRTPRSSPGRETSHFFGVEKSTTDSGRKLAQHDNKYEVDNRTISHQRYSRPKTIFKPVSSVDAIRRRLLQTSDWLGLSAARPVDIRFMPAQEIAKIGRHKKSRTSMPQQPDYTGQFAGSILGKRKRHSQLSCTPARNEEVVAAQSSSSVPIGAIASSPPELVTSYMDSAQQSVVDAGLSLPGLAPTDLARASYKLDQHQIPPNSQRGQLVPLERARAFSSFDEVHKQYLSSISKLDQNAHEDPMMLRTETTQRNNQEYATGHVTDASMSDRVLDQLYLTESPYMCAGEKGSAILDSIHADGPLAEFDLEEHVLKEYCPTSHQEEEPKLYASMPELSPLLETWTASAKKLHHPAAFSGGCSRITVPSSKLKPHRLGSQQCATGTNNSEHYGQVSSQESQYRNGGARHTAVSYIPRHKLDEQFNIPVDNMATRNQNTLNEHLPCPPFLHSNKALHTPSCEDSVWNDGPQRGWVTSYVPEANGCRDTSRYPSRYQNGQNHVDSDMAETGFTHPIVEGAKAYNTGVASSISLPNDDYCTTSPSEVRKRLRNFEQATLSSPQSTNADFLAHHYHARAPSAGVFSTLQPRFGHNQGCGTVQSPFPRSYAGPI